MVGAGSCQINGIKRLKDKGYYCIAADYSPSSKGKKLSDMALLVDAFDAKGVTDQARAHHVDGILTMGTDQPVLTVAMAQEALGLPAFISPEVALSVTHKKVMKDIFAKNAIPTVAYTFVKPCFPEDTLNRLKKPYVLKPVDSQGQRGIFLCHSLDEVRKNLPKTLAYSREDYALVESYYKNDEITVSGWVHEDILHIFTVTDRVTFSPEDQIGVCQAHEYPSRHFVGYEKDITKLTQKICQCFSIKEGPIYFQFFIGEQGLKVNEIACRIGGAYEDITIPYVSGVDILDLVIEGALGHPPRGLEKGQLKKSRPTCFSTELFFCKEGTITDMTPIEAIRDLPFIHEAGYNYAIGDTISSLENASQRAGYAIVIGETEDELAASIDAFYKCLQIKSGDRQLVITRKWRS